MPDSQYERLPQAGDIERHTGLEILYLAPRPVPTGQAAISAQQMHREINSTYLDFAQGTGRIEFGVRVTIGTLIAGLVFFFTCTVFLGWVDYVDRGSSIWDFVLKFFFMNWYMWLFMLFFATVFGGIFAYAVYQETRHPPIRFNRQRREVCYIPAKDGLKKSFLEKWSPITMRDTGQRFREKRAFSELPQGQTSFYPLGRTDRLRLGGADHHPICGQQPFRPTPWLSRHAGRADVLAHRAIAQPDVRRQRVGGIARLYGTGPRRPATTTASRV